MCSNATYIWEKGGFFIKTVYHKYAFFKIIAFFVCISVIVCISVNATAQMATSFGTYYKSDFLNFAFYHPAIKCYEDESFPLYPSFIINHPEIQITYSGSNFKGYIKAIGDSTVQEVHSQYIPNYYRFPAHYLTTDEMKKDVVYDDRHLFSYDHIGPAKIKIKDSLTRVFCTYFKGNLNFDSTVNINIVYHYSNEQLDSVIVGSPGNSTFKYYFLYNDEKLKNVTEHTLHNGTLANVNTVTLDYIFSNNRVFVREKVHDTLHGEILNSTVEKSYILTDSCKLFRKRIELEQVKLNSLHPSSTKTISEINIHLANGNIVVDDSTYSTFAGTASYLDIYHIKTKVFAVGKIYQVVKLYNKRSRNWFNLIEYKFLK